MLSVYNITYIMSCRLTGLHKAATSSISIASGVDLS